MIRNIFLVISIIISFSINSFSQPGKVGNSQGTGTILGTVVDKISGQPLEYSSVAVYKLQDSSLVTGTVTNSKGLFQFSDLSFGKYYIMIQFLGYENSVVNDVKITPEKSIFDMGIIILQPSLNEIKGVDVEAEQSPVLYKIDKKVINVSSNLNASGGTAVDVLENTPSVKVDIEGNVSLRGSENFVVLIDGRPSPFEGTDALQQVPAGMIDKVEIITNPSVKYNPDGTSGIINIITKKKSMQGMSGIVNINADTQGSYGGDLTINIKNNNINYFVGANLNNRVMKGYSESEERYFYNDTTNYIFKKGDRGGGRNSNGIKAGFDFSPTVFDNIMFSAETGEMSHERNSSSEYLQYNLPDSFPVRYLSDNKNGHGGNFLNLNLDYIHKFNSKGHELKGLARYEQGSSKSDNRTNLFNFDNSYVEGRKTIEDGNDKEIEVKFDYSLPFSETRKLEAGTQARIDIEDEGYSSHTLDINSGTYFEDTASSTVSEYQRNIYSVYGLYLGEWKSFGYQVGMRGEYTKRIMHNVAKNEDYPIDRFDYFPSAHISLQLPFKQQLMASYSRRIERPRNYFLEPFITYRDPNSVYMGNPSLEPEYIDSYELSYQKAFGMSSFSIEAYLRQNNNKIERIQSVYSENIMLSTFDNIGKDLATGTEIMLNWISNDWYTLNISGNVYYYKIDGSNLSNGLDNESTNWDARVRNTFKIGKKIKLQADMNYEGPSVTSQGKSEGSFAAGSAVSMDFFEDKLKATIQVRDIFGTSRHAFELYGEGFYSKSSFNRDAPVFSVSISYKINNYKEKKGINSNGTGSGGGDMEF